MAKGEGSIGPEVVGYTYPPTKVDNPRGLKHPYRAGPAAISIYSLSQNQEAAYKLLEAATSSESQIEMTRENPGFRSEEHTSELQSLMRISYAVFCLKKKNKTHNT